MTNLKAYIPAIIWVFIILFLSGYPGSELPKIAIWQIDKFGHIIMYGTLSFLLLFPFVKQFLAHNKWFKISLLVILSCVLYGGLMEILQNNIFINRSGNWIDFMANTIGAIMGAVLFYSLLKILPIKKWRGYKIKYCKKIIIFIN